MKTKILTRPVISWSLYDWANSAFATTVIAGFFPLLYNRLSAGVSAETAQFWFSVVLAVGGLVVAILSPLLGALADYGNQRKKFLVAFMLLGVLMALGLAWASLGLWWLALLLYGFGQIGFFGSNTFYDSLLITVSKPKDFHIVSGLGYAFGYIGGGLLFLLNVFMVTKPAVFGFADQAQALSWSFTSVAIWWLVFSLPLIFFVKEPVSPAPIKLATISLSIKELGRSFTKIRNNETIWLFLLAYWFYIDGVGTVFKVAIFFASRILLLPIESLIGALLLIQFIAFPASLALAWLGNKVGAKYGILFAIFVYLWVIIYAWYGLDTVAGFYYLAVAVGLVQGGIQSLSRSFFAALIPYNKTAEYFGIYNMMGKFAGILGPLLIALIPIIVPNSTPRDSILGLLILFLFGGYLLYKVPTYKQNNA